MMSCIAALVLTFSMAGIEVAGPPLPAAYIRHVFFENSAADGSYYHSEATVVAPSVLDVGKEKWRVKAGRFVGWRLAVQHIVR